MTSKDVAIVWVGERGVTVKGTCAYEQQPGNDLGHVVGVFQSETL